MGKIVRIQNSSTIFRTDDTFYKNLSSNKYSFKLPTILSKYRKNINASISIHNFLQECLLKRGTEDYTHVHDWFLSYISEDNFLDDIIKSIENDISHIISIENYNYCVFKHKDPCLQKFKSKLNHALESITAYKESIV